MKQLFNIFCVFGIILLFLVMPVYAQQSELPMTIELIGDAVNLSFTETEEIGFVYDGVFLPGESVKRVLKIKNEKNVPFRLSFELERVYSDVEYDLLEKINIEIYEGDALLCTGVIDENNCNQRQFYVELNPNDERELTMIATLSLDAGNEYKNKYAQYDWIFDAVVTKIPTTNNLLVNTGAYAIELITVGVLITGFSCLTSKIRNKKGEKKREQ